MSGNDNDADAILPKVGMRNGVVFVTIGVIMMLPVLFRHRAELLLPAVIGLVLVFAGTDAFFRHRRRHRSSRNPSS